jgi:hypothetical protein
MSTAVQDATPVTSSDKESRLGDNPAAKHDRQVGFASRGVKDFDLLRLPGADYRSMAYLTICAFIVRFFRLSYPNSVVFDEVQYVCAAHVHM